MKVNVVITSMDYPDLNRIVSELEELQNLHPGMKIEAEIRQMD